MRERQSHLLFGIHEVYYEKGKITNWTECTIAPFGETLDELHIVYDMQKEAFNQPVLIESELLAKVAKKTLDKSSDV